MALFCKLQINMFNILKAQCYTLFKLCQFITQSISISEVPAKVIGDMLD